MNAHDRRSKDDDERLKRGDRPAKTVGARVNLERSIRDLQATAGNRAVSDMMAGSGPTLQGSFFGGTFGGLDDWLDKESSGGASGFDPSTKAEAGEPTMKEAPSDNSMKVADASDKWDSSDKWEPSEKLDASEKWDASEKAEPELASKDDEFTEFEEEF